MIEAMALGVPVLATGYSGNLAYCDDATAWLVPATEVAPALQDYMFTPEGGLWGEPDHAAAVTLLRQMADSPTLRQRKAQAAQMRVSRTFSAEAIGKRYAAADRHDPAAGKGQRRMRRILPFRKRPSYVIGVSWPRSGHHLLARLLRLYYGPTFTYCGFYGQPDCCGQVPCARAGEIRYSKNHDFDGSLPQDASSRYLIQTRAFAPSVVSNFELYLREGGSDDAASFARFASAQFTAYRAFQDKWVTSDFAQSQTVIPYEALIRDPAMALTYALSSFGDTDPDPTRLRAAVVHVDGEEVAERRITPRPGTRCASATRCDAISPLRRQALWLSGQTDA